MGEVPECLKDDVTVLNHGNKHVFLLGTAHVSQKSCEDARLLIESVRPGVVFLELCDKRSKLLVAPEEDLKPAPFPVLLKRLHRGEINLLSFTYSIMLENAAKELEIIPGGEFRAAYESAMKVKASVVLGDRPVEVTLRRVWQGLTTFEKTCLVFQLLFSGINMPTAEELRNMLETLRKKTDLITEAVQELGRSFPWIVESLIDERDQFMVIGLRECVKRYPGNVVAVVGAGHLPGITRRWEESIGPSEEASDATTLADLLKYPGDSSEYTLPQFRAYVSERLRIRAASLLAQQTSGSHLEKRNIWFSGKRPSYSSLAVAAFLGTAVGSLLLYSYYRKDNFEKSISLKKLYVYIGGNK